MHCHSPLIPPKHSSTEHGFTLAEVIVTVLICALFAAAAFAANSRLLLSLQSQKETTAAMMLLQRRMESLRASAWRDIGTASYLQTQIIANPSPTNASLTPQQIADYAAGIQNGEAPLNDLNETITVSAYPANASITNGVAQRNSTYPTGHVTSTISNNASETRDTVYTYLQGKGVTMLRVDVLVTWDGAGSRANSRRSRQISSIFGIGNIAP